MDCVGARQETLVEREAVPAELREPLKRMILRHFNCHPLAPDDNGVTHSSLTRGNRGGTTSDNHLQGTISHLALRQLVKSEEYAREALKQPRSKDFVCNKAYRAQYGLPCFHDWLDIIRGNVPNRYIPLRD